jgi:hypothetical protein
VGRAAARLRRGGWLGPGPRARLRRFVRQGPAEHVDPAARGSYRLYRVCSDDAPEEGEKVPQRLTLGRAEVAYVLPE